MFEHVVFGDLIIDVYKQVLQKNNQEVENGKKLIYYYDDLESKYLLGGAGNYYKNLNVDAIFANLVFSKELLKVGDFTQNFKYKFIYSTNFDEKLIPIKTRFIDNNNNIIIRYDEEYKRHGLTYYDIEKEFSKINKIETKSIALIDYDKYYFSRLGMLDIFMLVKLFIKNVEDLDFILIMPKPKNIYALLLSMVSFKRKIFIFLNEYERAEIDNDKEFLEDIVRIHDVEIITTSAKGIKLLNKSGEKFVKNDYYIKNIHNTSGAGDVFAANFVNSYLKNKKVEDSIKYSFKQTAEFLKKLNKI